MSQGFVSGSQSYGAGVSVRFCTLGFAWAFRASAAGLRPAPACIFVPFSSHAQASAFARSVAVSSGWRVWLRSGSRCSCWAGTSSEPAWAVKVALPAGLSAARARAYLQGVE